MKVTKSASVVWTGGFKDGKGLISTQSGAVRDVPYGVASRFEGAPGSNPEELIGAAHAACFTMALSLMLSEAGVKVERLRTHADVAIEKQEQGFAITSSKLKLMAKIDGDRAQFEQIAQKAKANCPVSKVLNTDISLEIAFED
jgi:osmotically inducible protein OsmC